MNEMSSVLQEVLKALGIDCAEGTGLRSAVDAGHPPRPLPASAAGYVTHAPGDCTEGRARGSFPFPRMHAATPST